MAPSSPKPASDRSVVAAAFAAIALFVVSWTLLHVGFYKHKQLIDTPVYQRYGNAIADGKVPYRDFEVEYPPGALPVFALPGLAEPGREPERVDRLPPLVRDADVVVRRRRACCHGSHPAHTPT